MTRTLLVLVALAPTAWLAAEQGQVFRGGTDVVTIDVNVQDGKRPIAGLTAADFDVRDNGVRQVVTDVTYARVPIDLRLVFDTSGSISDDQLKAYLKTMVEVTGSLQPSDRCDIVSFAARIVDAASLQSPPIKIDLQRAEPNATSFYDAVSLSLITAAVPGRRQLTIVLSDADDNSSFFDQGTLIDTGRRTDAVVYAVLPDPMGHRRNPVQEKMLKDRLTRAHDAHRRPRDSRGQGRDGGVPQCARRLPEELRRRLHGDRRQARRLARTESDRAEVAGLHGARQAGVRRVAMAQGWPVAVAVAINLIAAPLHPRAPQNPATTPFDTLYRSYADGHYDAVANEIKTVADLNSLNPPKPDDLRKWLGTWDRTKAAYLLELAAAAGPISRSAQIALLSEGRLYAISRTAPIGTSAQDDEFEVLWHKTAIAELERSVLWTYENLYLDTLDRRYTARPGGPRLTLDARLVFQRAVATEQYCWHAPKGIAGSLPPPPTSTSNQSVPLMGGQPIDIVPPNQGPRSLTHNECLADGAKRFAAVGGSAPEIAAEAFTRAAWLKAQLGSYKDALELIDRAGATDDGTVTYWRHLFRGRVLTGLNRDADAESEYRAALDARASAHSASVGLALTLFNQRRLDEARALATSIRQAPPDVVDPWWTYLAADARFVTKWVEEVREKIRPQGQGPRP